jgi:hypothetical protein
MGDTRPDDDELLALVKESREHSRAWVLVRGLANQLLGERAARRGAARSTEIGTVGPVCPRGVSGAEGPCSCSPFIAKIHELEEKIGKQKRHLRTIEECRTFELETERLLVTALGEIKVMCRGGAYFYGESDDRHRPQPARVAEHAAAALRQYETRHGPRPERTESDDG